MADSKDKKIGEVPHLENVKGDEKIPVSADGEAGFVDIKQIYDKEVTPYPKANEIVYTTTDGEIIELEDANLVSNVYYKDKGFGVMRFKEDLEICPLFSYKAKLLKIILPNNIKQFPNLCFRNCTSLVNINFPSSLNHIGSEVFGGCLSLDILSVPIKWNGYGTFSRSGVKQFNISQNTGLYDFSECKNLTSINISEGVTTLGQLCFNGCSRLSNIIFPSSLTTIGGGTFSYCCSITNITLPEKCLLIYQDAFSGCTPFYFDCYLPTTQGFPAVNKLRTLILRYDGVVKDVDTYASTFIKEPIAIPEASTLDLVDTPMPMSDIEDGIMPMANLDTYVGTPNNWLKIYVPENRLKEYQETYPTLKSHFHPITGEDIYAMREEVEKAVDIVSVSGETLNAEVGKYYRFDEEVNTLDVTLPKISEVSKLSSLVLSFTTGDEPQVTISADVDVDYFSGYSIEPNTKYELNLMFNGSKWIVAYGTVE